MAAGTTSVSLNAETVRQAKGLFADFGLDLPTVIEMFLRQSVKEQRIPFDIGEEVPNAETKEALEEIKEMKAHPERFKSYGTFQELLDEVLVDA